MSQGNQKSFWKMLGEYKIVIPKIQRDYAQGREGDKATAIRNKLVKALFEALNENNALELDFVYGYYTDEAKTTFFPLDGQQRLTTLFLLHWYIAIKEGVIDETIAHLKNFTYETRHSSKVFCEWLCELLAEKFRPTISPKVKISEIIEDSPRFFIAWKNDPTIKSMLTMLDAIHDKFAKIDQGCIWKKLTSNEPKIFFNLLQMGELGLHDELYIKMNSRGKPLTDFEHFKCQFAELLSDDDKGDFEKKIDSEWYDVFWSLYAEKPDPAAEADQAILRYFCFITDILVNKNKITIPDKVDDFEKFKRVYSGDKNVAENVKFLFVSLDKLVEKKEAEWKFFTETFYVGQVPPEGDKYPFTVNPISSFVIPAEAGIHPTTTPTHIPSGWIPVEYTGMTEDGVNGYGNNSVRLFEYPKEEKENLLKGCADKYDPLQRENPFGFREQLLLYASIFHWTEKVECFPEKIRMLRNIASHPDIRLESKRFSGYIKEIDILFRNGIEELLKEGKTEFTNSIIQEEWRKHDYLQRKPEMRDSLWRLEDHDLLRGCLAFFESTSDSGNYDEAQKYEKTFRDLFREDMKREEFDKINRALLTIGDYAYENGRRTQFLITDTLWRKTLLDAKQFKGLILKLLDKSKCDMDCIIDDYLNEFKADSSKEKDWRYYYLKSLASN